MDSYKPKERCGNAYCKKYLFPSDPYPKVFGTYLPYNPGTGFTTTISGFLTEAGIPNLHWGTGAWGALGLETVGEDTQFIVPDRLLDAAADAIAKKAHMPKCPFGKDRCPIVKQREWPNVPDVHFHINHNEACLTLDLFKKSRIPWRFQDLTLTIPAVNDPVFTLAGNLQGHRPGSKRFADGRAPFHPDGNPVRILTAAATVNALIHLCVREYRNGNRWTVWAEHLLSVIRVLTIQDREKIESRFRAYVSSMVEYAGGDMSAIIRELCDEVPDENLNNVIIDCTTSWLDI